MPEAPAAVPAGPPQPLCASGALSERGQAIGFDVLLWNQPARAFAMRFDSRVVAYINRCVHVPVEMDWQPGQFLDMDKRWIVCSIHGASYEPADGRCVGGPCGRGKLLRVHVAEADGQVHWYPSEDIRPRVVNTVPAPPESPRP
ncbi:MAG: 2Fe-2S ferredoxin [Burkholderiales bacterium PBB5]|nr:MAG: 2Fe-2S ferredoxin [Burkholderiales bacterium PBB5]